MGSWYTADTSRSPPCGGRRRDTRLQPAIATSLHLQSRAEVTPGRRQSPARTFRPCSKYSPPRRSSGPGSPDPARQVRDRSPRPGRSFPGGGIRPRSGSGPRPCPETGDRCSGRRRTARPTPASRPGDLAPRRRSRMCRRSRSTSFRRPHSYRPQRKPRPHRTNTVGRRLSAPDQTDRSAPRSGGIRRRRMPAVRPQTGFRRRPQAP